MRRSYEMLSLIALVCLALPEVSAQDSITSREVRDLRGVVEKQSKQIEVLTAEVAKLHQAIEGKVIAPAPSVQTSVPVPVAVAVQPAPNEFSTDVPKAEAADGKRHVVVKGETLTSVAKHYNISLAELQKANKEVDERKLQIGQTLTIPTPKTPEAPTAKKENP